ncbi:DUF2894 domain-containing protein [Limnohabitans sp. DM1]|uniref:DUF2894 domain-containing protein n=1 Tax=Limnohabitans sp. DM1 TaxID=1597955 RepID=UPI000A8A9106|nr:DUF2894 domain-containing protein [Limnohabitans sp. DM1]
MSDTPAVQTDCVAALMDALRSRGAAQVDPIGWHYIETLAKRTGAQSDAVQPLLNRKLRDELERLQAQMGETNAQKGPNGHHEGQAPPLGSPLSALLSEMTRHTSLAGPSDKPPSSRPENPRVQQFRQQLHKISVQKSVTQAIAQAPQNAGPINSHMLVLRSLGLMRDICPDYLNRFMLYVDTLLCLDEAGQAKHAPGKSATAAKSKK